MSNLPPSLTLDLKFEAPFSLHDRAGWLTSLDGVRSLFTSTTQGQILVAGPEGTPLIYKISLAALSCDAVCAHLKVICSRVPTSPRENVASSTGSQDSMM